MTPPTPEEIEAELAICRVKLSEATHPGDHQDGWYGCVQSLMWVRGETVTKPSEIDFEGIEGA